MALAQTLRSLARRPSYTLSVVATFALGIGGATAVFSIVDAALLRPMNVPDPDRVVALGQLMARGTMTSYSYPAYRDFQQAAAPALDLAAYSTTRVTLQAGDQLERAQVEIVSANYFRVMEQSPVVGRFFRPEDDLAPGSGPVCVVSERFWRTRLGSSAAVLGSTAVVNRVPVTIVGVAPAAFLGYTRGSEADVWLPVSMYAAVRFAGVTRLFGRTAPTDIFAEADWHWLELVGRLAPEASAVQVASALSAATRTMPSLALAGRETWPVRLTGVPQGLGGRTDALKVPLAATSAAVALLLLLACANVANLMLAREAARARDHAIRLSLGASRPRLIGSLLGEHTVLVCAGGVLGLAAAGWLATLVPVLQPGILDEVRVGARLDARVAGLALALVAAAVFASGLLPAMRAARGAVAPALHRGGSVSGRTGRLSRLRHALVALQVGISLVLLVGAGVLGRSLLNLTRVPLGFDPSHTLAASVSLGEHVADTERGMAFTRLVRERLAAVPGVEAVSFANSVPIDRRHSSMGGFVPDGMEHPPERGVQLTLNVVSPGYFRAMGIPVRAGRAFEPGDPAGMAAGIVLNETAARVFFPGRNPVGLRMARMAVAGRPAQSIEVIGVVADSRYENLEQPVRPLAYFHAEHPVMGQVMPDQWMVIRTTGDPLAVLPALQVAVRSIDRSMALLEPTRMADRVARATSLHRTMAAIVALFGLAAIILAAVGLYGVLTQVVLERTREIGIRVALGAQRRQIILMVIRSAAVTMALGVAVGLAVAATTGRFAASLLFGVQPADPLTLAAVAGLLGATGALTALAPARRAASVDPAVSLRAE